MGDPVNYVDPSGNSAWWIAGGVIGAIGGAIAGGIYSYETTGSVDWKSVAIGAVGGALVGAGLGFLAEGAAAAFAGIGGATAVTAEKVIERAKPAAEKVANVQQGLNFSTKAAEHMSNPARHVPVQTLQQVIKSTPAMLDPRGSTAVMHYSTMFKNNKIYNLEVLYHQATNTVYHFEYTRKAIGLLPQILK